MIDERSKLKLVAALMTLRGKASVEHDPKQWERELLRILVSFIVKLGFSGFQVIVEETVRAIHRTEGQITRKKGRGGY